MAITPNSSQNYHFPFLFTACSLAWLLAMHLMVQWLPCMTWAGRLLLVRCSLQLMISTRFVSSLHSKMVIQFKSLHHFFPCFIPSFSLPGSSMLLLTKMQVTLPWRILFYLPNLGGRWNFRVSGG